MLKNMTNLMNDTNNLFETRIRIKKISIFYGIYEQIAHTQFSI